jgi:hypothetical protein
MKVHNQTGATLTKIAREHSLNHLRSFARQTGAMPTRLHEMASKHIERYVEAMKAEGVSARTLQNRLSHIRGELRAIGRDKLADSERLGTKALGIDQASRDGTHAAPTLERYQAALEALRELNPAHAACMELQRELGLRAREAVQSSASLAAWQRSIERGAPIRVSKGTKGGRARDTTPVAPERALNAIKAALEACKANDGVLVASSSLEGAMRSYGRSCEAVGMVGEHASHSLRCLYAQERYAQHLERFEGDRKEALAATSCDLGHGDGRGTYVAQVYLRG